MTTPLEEQDRTIIHIPKNVSTVLVEDFVLRCASRRPEVPVRISRMGLEGPVTQRPFEGRDRGPLRVTGRAILERAACANKAGAAAPLRL